MSSYNLKAIRKEHHDTQKELAEKTGYQQSFISEMETGKVNMPDYFIERLKEIYGIEDLEKYRVEKKRSKPGRPPKEDQISSKIVERMLSIIESQNVRLAQLEERIRELESKK